MDAQWMKAVLIAFAIIGALMVLAMLGAIVLHGGMMGMMHSFGNMIAACLSMVGMRPYEY